MPMASKRFGHSADEPTAAQLSNQVKVIQVGPNGVPMAPPQTNFQAPAAPQRKKPGRKAKPKAPSVDLNAPIPQNDGDVADETPNPKQDAFHATAEGGEYAQLAKAWGEHAFEIKWREREIERIAARVFEINDEWMKKVNK